MELREYREEDRVAVARLATRALGVSVEGWGEHYALEKNPRLDPGQVYVVEEDGGLRATAAVLPLEVFVDGRSVAMGSLADGVDSRRRGYAGELVRSAGCGSGASTSRCSTLSTAATGGSWRPRR